MGVHTLYLDSRERQSGSIISNPTFVLSSPILNVTSVEMRSFSFGNTIHNIDEDNNQLNINGNDVIIHPGFYTPLELTQKLGELGLSCTVSTNILTWQVGSNVFSCGPGAADIFGLEQNTVYSGNLTSILTLASPLAIQISSPSLQIHGGDVSSSSSKRNFAPLMIVSVTSGYGVMQVYEPNHKLEFHISNRCLDRITFNIHDARANHRRIDEMKLFSFAFFLHTSDV